MNKSEAGAKQSGSKPEETGRRLRAKDMLCFLKLTSGMGKEYAFSFVFLFLQIASYQLLAYSLKFLINTLIPMKRADYLLLYLLCWVAAFAIHSAFTLLSSMYRIKIIRSLVANIRANIVRKLQVLSIRYFDLHGTGFTSAKILMDVERMRGFFEWIIYGFVLAVITLVCIIPLLSSINVILMAVTVLYVPVIPLVQRVFLDTLHRHARALRDTNARFSEKLIDFITGIKHIRSFATEDEHSDRILAEVDVVKETDIRYSTIMLNYAMLIQFVNESVPIVLWIAAGIIMIRTDSLTTGSVVAYIALVGQLRGAINELYSSFDQIVQASPSVAAVMEILDSQEVENQCPKIVDFDIDGSISVKNVDFSYESMQGRKQLSGVNMTIRPGEKVAFVGESGAGKSTFVNVLLGLYPVASGEIMFGPYHLGDLRLRRLRAQIAVMSQETFLFNTSLIDNVRLARIDATDGEVVEACREAEIYDFIKSLPEGMNTCAGERGVMLSSGQRQRIGLARVFVRNPRIIILDEPSSSLDVLTESRLFDTLYRHIGDRTLIVVAHRLSTISRVDRVFVFKGGTIAEQGRFEELLKTSGILTDMVRASLPER